MRATRRRVAACAVLAVFLSANLASADDLVEFLSGRKLSGKVVTIRKEKKEFDFRYKIAGREFTKTYRFGEVHAVTLNGKRHEITSRPAKSTTGSAAKSTTSRRLSKTELRRLIKTAGETPPDWFESTKLHYPKTLDLDWPIKPPKKGWNNQVNMGQYIWDVINPNPNRWRPGIKLVHQCLAKHQGNRELVNRDMSTLGRMYFTLLQDYPRAAYWFERAGVDMTKPAGAMLAESYWRMGNRQMAEEMLRNRRLPVAAIKLLGDLGRVNDAVRMAKTPSLRGNTKALALILGADALRSAGRTREAIAMYQQIINDKDFSNPDYEKRFKGRARDSIDALQLAGKAVVSRVADGSYNGNAIGYNGRMHIRVDVQSGKITSVKVTKHNEKQFYSAINDTTTQIMKTQGVRDIDATTGATITSQAIVNAAARALASGAK